MKPLLIISILCTAACIVKNDAAEVKFFTISAGRQLDRIKFMTPKVHEPQWKIGYRYGAECKHADRQNGEALKEAMSNSLRSWLQPLKELKLDRPIVDQFIFELQPDFNPINPEDTYNLNEPEDLAGWAEVDLRVTFQCRQGISFALTGLKFQPAVFMRLGTAITPDLLIVLTHELGHSFGLDDTIARETTPPGVMQSHGGLHNTAGKQPASVMAFSSDYHSDTLTPLALGEDDKRGIIWLYKYFHANVPPNDCFFDDYIYVQITEPYLVHRCVPKYPLIFETKHNPAKHALQLLKDDPSININAQDAGGMTALHYAAMYGKQEVVKALLALKDIKPAMQNNHGETPYDLAVATGNSEILKLLPASLQRKEDVNNDGVVNILDLVAVAAKFGQKDTGTDVNGDGKVDILDLVLVAGAFGETAAAPSLLTATNLTATTVANWIAAAQKLTLTADYVRGLRRLQELHAQLSQPKTELLANYPNPFNPETWLPYRLSKDAQVSIRIYNTHGVLVRSLAIGHQRAGVYQDKSRAAYWDGKNKHGELAASGVYFYTLSAGDFTATRKMLLRK